MGMKMTVDLVAARITQEVDRLFEADGKKYSGQWCQIPILGGGYIPGEDDIEPLRKHACAALLAREWFAIHGPADAPPLPVSMGEREDLKCGGPRLNKIIALYARSLDGRNYDVKEHPSFFDYACGLMASEFIGGYDYMQRDEQLRKRFPPRTLEGLGPGLTWQPPREHWERMELYYSSLARLARCKARLVESKKTVM
jgi:hypothetical protein